MVGESQKARSLQGDKLVVAAVDLPVGTKLDPTQMKTITMPKENFPAGGFKDPTAVTGRVVIKPLSAGDQITEQKLMPKEGTGAAGVMSFLVPPGHRAVTVGVNEVAGVAGFLAPNNRVDVVLTAPMPNNPNESITKIVLQNVPVLATGQITEQKEGKPVVVPTVTLDLTPEDAEKLIQAAYAGQRGSLQMLLRNITDTAVVPGKGTTIRMVLGGVETRNEPAAVKSPKKAAPKAEKKAVTAPAAPSPAPVAAPKKLSVEIIKGRERTTKEFSE
jgi:pilus assembly protein CpaB